MTCALCAAPRMKARGYLAALPSLIKERIHGEIFRDYLAEGLRVLTQNTARQGGMTLTRQYREMIAPQPDPEKEERTAQEIFERVKAALRGR